MATATAGRNAPRGDYALPDEKAYPLNTPGRRKLAPSAAARAERVGHISPAQENSIDRKAAAARKAHGEGGTTSAAKATVKATNGGLTADEHMDRARYHDAMGDQHHGQRDTHMARAAKVAAKSGDVPPALGASRHSLLWQLPGM